MQQILDGNLKPAISMAFGLLKAFVFHGAYWFIPVTIVIVFVLILFKNHLDKLWFAIALASISLFYNVNLYHRWIPTDHAKAFLSYTFFMWLGIQIKRHIHQLKRIIDKLSWPVLLGMMVLTFAISCWEGLILIKIGCTDPYASLRWSNSAISILLFLSVLKSGKMKRVRRLKPQRYVYGVYLVHSIIGSELSPAYNRYILQHKLFNNFPGLILAQSLFFLAVLSLSYIAVMVVMRSPLYFTLGRYRYFHKPKVVPPLYPLEQQHPIAELDWSYNLPVLCGSSYNQPYRLYVDKI